jgi:hypothetical protein
LGFGWEKVVEGSGGAARSIFDGECVTGVKFVVLCCDL